MRGHARGGESMQRIVAVAGLSGGRPRAVDCITRPSFPPCTLCSMYVQDRHDNSAKCVNYMGSGLQHELLPTAADGPNSAAAKEAPAALHIVLSDAGPEQGLEFSKASHAVAKPLWQQRTFTQASGAPEPARMQSRSCSRTSWHQLAQRSKL
jgi:hypothetical protein